jgi:hypothetical protein
MWLLHGKVCLVFLLLAIPIAIADLWLLKGGSGGWISLNLRGFIIVPYLIFLVVHTIISSLTIQFIPTLGIGLIHTFSFLLSISLLGIGFKSYIAYSKKVSLQKYEAEQAKRKKIFNVLQLNSWWYTGDAERATELIVDVTSIESGRFSVHVSGFTDVNDVERNWYFNSGKVKQITVDKGEHIVHKIPLVRQQDGIPNEIEITLYLFADKNGSAGTNIIKVFLKEPDVDDDGHSFYEKLPPAVKIEK